MISVELRGKVCYPYGGRETKDTLYRLSHPDDPVVTMYLEYVRDKISSGNTEHAVFRFTMK